MSRIQMIATAIAFVAVAVAIDLVACYNDRQQGFPAAPAPYVQIPDAATTPASGPVTPTESTITLAIPVFPTHVEPQVPRYEATAIVYAAAPGTSTSPIFVDLPLPALSPDELIAAFVAVGIPSSLHDWFARIVWCESHNRPGEVGYAGSFLGLLQIHYDWFVRYNRDLSRWFDPLVNLEMGWFIYQVSGPSQWECRA